MLGLTNLSWKASTKQRVPNSHPDTDVPVIDKNGVKKAKKKPTEPSSSDRVTRLSTGNTKPTPIDPNNSEVPNTSRRRRHRQVTAKPSNSGSAVKPLLDEGRVLDHGSKLNLFAVLHH
jgi:hypothetical protein